jgi:transcriptional regulator with XRE-family HTH domain
MARDEVPGFSGRLKKLRESAGLSAEELGDKAETHPDSIYKLERGTRQPSLRLAWQLAEALGVEVTAFLPTKKAGKKKSADLS